MTNKQYTLEYEKLQSNKIKKVQQQKERLTELTKQKKQRSTNKTVV